MRMKEDHMGNGQLKPAYNLQVAVNSEYITGLGVFSNRTDFGTLVPLLQKMKKEHGCQYEEVCADAGYESLDNYLYLEENGQMSFMRPSNYEKKKTKKFKKQIGKVENMQYDPEEECFTCAGNPLNGKAARSSPQPGIAARIAVTVPAEMPAAMQRIRISPRR